MWYRPHHLSLTFRHENVPIANILHLLPWPCVPFLALPPLPYVRPTLLTVPIEPFRTSVSYVPTGPHVHNVLEDLGSVSQAPPVHTRMHTSSYEEETNVSLPQDQYDWA